MPNTFAFLAVFSWPLAVYLLFRYLPRAEALGWSILGGYLLLPTQAGMDLPLVPLIDKDVVPSLAAAIMLAFGMGGAATNANAGQIGSSPVQENISLGAFVPALILLLASPVITVFTNLEPLVFGPSLIAGLKAYDAVSIIGRLALTVLPFLLAVRYFASPASHQVLLKVIALGLLAYSLLILFEIRMSPQLNLMFYGFFPHDFGQHMRAGGFRPVVFLHHGIWLAVLVAMATVSAFALWRQRLIDGARAGQWFFAGLYLILVLFLSSSLGALALALMVVPVVALLGVRTQIVLAGVVAAVVLLYPVLRSVGLVPVDQVVAIAERISDERAGSLQFRLDNEDALSARAAEKPFAGWGTGARNQIFDPESGRMLSVTDGAWIIIIGVYGWLGYAAQFGLLTLPTLLLAFGRRSELLNPATAGLSLVLAVNLLDLLPNATLTPITWLLGGAIAGFCVYRVPEQQSGDRLLREKPLRSWSVITDLQRPTQRVDHREAQGSAVVDWHGPARRASPVWREKG